MTFNYFLCAYNWLINSKIYCNILPKKEHFLCFFLFFGLCMTLRKKMNKNHKPIIFFNPTLFETNLLSHTLKLCGQVRLYLKYPQTGEKIRSQCFNASKHSADMQQRIGLVVCFWCSSYSGHFSKKNTKGSISDGSDHHHMFLFAGFFSNEKHFFFPKSLRVLPHVLNQTQKNGHSLLHVIPAQQDNNFLRFLENTKIYNK